MSPQTARIRLSRSELERLQQCAREPIRTPGSIQPHGALLAVDARTFVVKIASANSAELIGSESPLLGRPLAEVTGSEFERAVRASVSASPVEDNPLPLSIGDQSFDAIVHHVDKFVVIELEPVLSDPSRLSTSALYALVHRLATRTTVEALRADTAAGLRDLTGFDRVMIYHFHPDGHGEIVADDHAVGMEPYGGLHFPASDIPAQARELYLTKRSRAIVATSEASVGLLAEEEGLAAAALDLSKAELRSVSPHHLQFMSNMGQESTLSFSMVRDGALIGMITCAHRTVLRVPFLLRGGIEVLANQVALQVSALERLEYLTRRVSVGHTRARLMEQIADTDGIGQSLLHGLITVRELIEADGVAVHLSGESRAVGDVPSTDELQLLDAYVKQIPSAGPFASDAVPVEHPDLPALGRSIAGVLVVRVGGNGDYLAFFRNEILRKVRWLGDQTSANRVTALSPRTSFSSWTDSVAGTADPWGNLILEGAELGRDIEGALLRKAEADLARLALHDPLTGLPNRRSLMDQLELALRMNSPERRVSLLFIDLDGFKNINDTYGHDAGDALITLVGQRILSATRAEDRVARLGGDEFVVLCDHTGPEEAEAIAARVRASISEPVTIGGVGLTITASVGIAVAQQDSDASELLQRADVEMYRAKNVQRKPGPR